MKIIVPVKLIPDLVEELTIDESGKALDMAWLQLILNEFDNQAIEQAILLKEKHGGEVIVIAPDVEGAEEALYTAAAAGADRLIKLIEVNEDVNNHTLGRVCASLVKELEPTLILTGVQAHSDLDGQLGAILAEYIPCPYVGYISAIEIKDGKAIVSKEFPGGLIARLEVDLPAVVGIQAAEEPPRYVAFSRVRQAMKISEIEEFAPEEFDPHGSLEITRMYQPEVGERAEMITGDPEAIADRLVALFHERGVL